MEKCEWLTDREKAIFNLFYRRWQIEAIAAEMDVSRGTINNVLRHIREKQNNLFTAGNDSPQFFVFNLSLICISFGQADIHFLI